MSLRALGLRALQRPALESSANGRMHKIEAGASLSQALSMMSDLRIGSLLVGSAATQTSIDGIITERDVLEKLDFHAPLTSVTVDSLMTPASDMILADRSWTLERALQAMKRGNFRHLPISDDDERVSSMLSMRDAARELAHAAASTCVDDVQAGTAEVATAAATSAADLVRARSRSVQITPIGALPVGVSSPPSCVEVPSCASVAEAVLEMRRWRAGSVLVPVLGGSIAESRHGFGIFTERDYLRMLGSASRLEIALDARGVPVSRVMTAAASIRYVAPDTPAATCLSVMGRDDIRHLPVMQPIEVDPLGAQASPPAAADDAVIDRKLLAVLSMRDVLSRFLSSTPGSGYA